MNQEFTMSPRRANVLGSVVCRQNVEVDSSVECQADEAISGIFGLILNTKK